MGKKNFGNVVNETVTTPVQKHQEEIDVRNASVVRNKKIKMPMDASNSNKRTFSLRFEIERTFDDFAHDARIDKSALMNIMIKEWCEQNKGREDFETF